MLRIERFPWGKIDKPPIYRIYTDESNTYMLAEFNSIKEAGLVMRYLSAVEMPLEDQSKALELLEATDERRKRKAEEIIEKYSRRKKKQS